MRVCLAGWYFYQPLVEAFEHSGHCPAWVCHRNPSRDFPFPHDTIMNSGLEFGCYDWFLNNRWPSGSVLFMHDDNEITEAALDAISAMTVDQAFLFSSAADAEANGKAHGRAMFCSEKFLKRLKSDGGFWYSEAACDGKPIPATTATRPDYHNSGIQVFRAYLETLPKNEFIVARVAVVPGLKTGYRGRV